MQKPGPKICDCTGSSYSINQRQRFQEFEFLTRLQNTMVRFIQKRVFPHSLSSRTKTHCFCAYASLHGLCKSSYNSQTVCLLVCNTLKTDIRQLTLVLPSFFVTRLTKGVVTTPCGFQNETPQIHLLIHSIARGLLFPHIPKSVPTSQV